MDDILFSVSMCVYGKDNPEYFDVALNSVIKQTVKPAEVVLTIDGPIPESIEAIIQKYSKLLSETNINFVVVRLKENMGHGEARRVCFNNCSYPIIALMDADDISNNTRFEKEINMFASENDLAIVGSHVSEFFGDPENIRTKRVVQLTDERIKEDMKSRCPMNQPTVMFKKNAVDKVGGYIDWFCNEDYFLWIRLAKEGYKFANIDECLVNMRVDEESYKRRGGLKYFRSEKKIQQLLLSNEMISFPKYIINVTERLIVQVIMPNFMRAWVFKKFARKS